MSRSDPPLIVCYCVTRERLEQNSAPLRIGVLKDRIPRESLRMGGTKPAELSPDGEAERLTNSPQPSRFARKTRLSTGVLRSLLDASSLRKAGTTHGYLQRGSLQQVAVKATGHDRLHEVVLEAMRLRCLLRFSMAGSESAA